MGFVKICGMTDTRAVAAALAAGADAIGFVFAPSVRQVTPEQAAQLARPARGRALCVAVTQHPSAELLELIFEVFRPDVLQSDRDDLPGIDLPPGISTWPVLRGAADAPDEEAQGRSSGAASAARILFEGPRSGTGQVADWSTARTLARRRELILAGGLSPDNVAQAVAEVRPFGVDVSSGVEEAPGRKSPQLIEAFVSRARQAFAGARNGEA